MTCTLPREKTGKDKGFTVIEMMVVVSILLVVLALVGNVLISLMRASAKNENLVASQQQVLSAVTQFGRDLRSAATLNFQDVGCTATGEQLTSYYSTHLEMTEVGLGGGTGTTIAWVWDPTANTLSRQILTGPTLDPTGTFTSCGTVQSTNVMISGLTNVATNPVWQLYDQANTDLISTGTSAGLLVPCTVRVHLQPQVDATKGLTFADRDDVQMTNQVTALNGGNPARLNLPCP